LPLGLAETVPPHVGSAVALLVGRAGSVVPLLPGVLAASPRRTVLDVRLVRDAVPERKEAAGSTVHVVGSLGSVVPHVETPFGRRAQRGRASLRVSETLVRRGDDA
jgi:hypothetical protein